MLYGILIVGVEKWRVKVLTAITVAGIAVLLISTIFLSSLIREFLNDVETVNIIEQHENLKMEQKLSTGIRRIS